MTRPDLPSGTVTFLFTDIEGSTKLLHALGPERYADVLGEHRRALRQAFAAHGGVEVDTQGDAFFVAFPTAAGALQAAEQALQALEPGPIRVRIGLHTGTPTWARRATWERTCNAPPASPPPATAARCSYPPLPRRSFTPTACATWGSTASRTCPRPRASISWAMAIFRRFARSTRPTLVAASALIGRTTELVDLAAMLSDGARLVTVTGPGGTGKIRLALQVAAELVGTLPATTTCTALCLSPRRSRRSTSHSARRSRSLLRRPARPVYRGRARAPRLRCRRRMGGGPRDRVRRRRRTRPHAVGSVIAATASVAVASG